MQLNLSIYTPTNYILASRLAKYIDLGSEHSKRLSQSGREEGIRRLMSINLLKRMESSVHSFKLTVKRIFEQIYDTLELIDTFQAGTEVTVQDISDFGDLDLDDQNIDIFTVGKKFRIDLGDMDFLTWRRDLSADLEILDLLLLMIEDITPEHDYKLNELLRVIEKKITNPINRITKRLLFSPPLRYRQYLYEHVSALPSPDSDWTAP